MGPLWCSSHDTRAGRVCVAAGERGVTDLSLGGTEEGFISSIRIKYGIEPMEGRGRLSAVFKELDRYFDGGPMRFSALVAPLGTAFEEAVWRSLRRIPWGQSRSYSEVASMIGCPKGARAVGNACGANPVPVIIPCHRVVRSNGCPGGYSAGPGTRGMKEMLLGIEGVAFKRQPEGPAGP
jgi:O-6-methylguanine DNA methyltransferase